MTDCQHKLSCHFPLCECKPFMQIHDSHQPDSTTIAELRAIQRKPKRNKYGNKPVVYDDKRFDSTKEQNKYITLKFRERAGEITNLKHHEVFSIYINGQHICDYEADFSYLEKNELGNWVSVVIDVKGMKRVKYFDKNGKKKTKSNAAYEMFLLKKKLMKAVLNICIKEI